MLMPVLFQTRGQVAGLWIALAVSAFGCGASSQTAARAPNAPTTPDVPSPPPLPSSTPTASTGTFAADSRTVTQPQSAPSGKVRANYESPMPLAQQQPAETNYRHFSVHGVDSSDVLHVRAEPGPQSAVVGDLPPGANGVVATGGEKQIGPSVWREITYGSIRGWVNGRFLIDDASTDSAPSRKGGRKAKR